MIVPMTAEMAIIISRAMAKRIDDSSSKASLKAGRRVCSVIPVVLVLMNASDKLAARSKSKGQPACAAALVVRSRYPALLLYPLPAPVDAGMPVSDVDTNGMDARAGQAITSG